MIELDLTLTALLLVGWPNKMSASEKARQENMVLALRLLMQDLGEPYEWQEHDAKAPKFAAVLRTTGDELAERGLLKAHSFDRYALSRRALAEGAQDRGVANPGSS